VVLSVATFRQRGGLVARKKVVTTTSSQIESQQPNVPHSRTKDDHHQHSNERCTPLSHAAKQVRSEFNNQALVAALPSLHLATQGRR
jgi:hypothetical protein